MSAHTPGPWVVCTDAPNATWVEGRTIYSEPTGTRVADAFLWAFSGEEGVAANARLIAAAPDLLEALSMYVAVCGNTGFALSMESAKELYDKAAPSTRQSRRCRMTLTRPDRFDIPGLSPDRNDWLEQAFKSVFPEIPKPITPETEPQS